MDALQGRVQFYKTEADRGKFKGFVRGSPYLFKRPEDGQLIFDLLRQAKAAPVLRPVDPKKLAKVPQYKVQRRRGSKVIATTVTVPEVDTTGEVALPGEVKGPTHTEIQWRLLTLGSAMASTYGWPETTDPRYGKASLSETSRA